MAEFYPYLISSLPMLQFGGKPAFSFDRFIEMCEGLIPDEDLAQVKQCAGDAFLQKAPSQPALAQWAAFETGLRNELVRLRAVRKKIDAQKYLRPDGSGDVAMYHIAMNSHRIPSLVESEKFLDRERWHRLEELSFGHYFDCDALIVYALKLRILLRWEIIDRADKQEALERILA
jgi:hypothetical protein